MACGALFFVMTNVDPYEGTIMDFVLFYLTLGMSLIGLLSFMGSLYRVKVLKRKDVVSREVKIAFRHAILLSFVAVLSLILLTQGLFHIWVLLLLIVVSSGIEFVALKIQQSARG